MNAETPLEYTINQAKSRGIDMHCICDGEFLYDEQFHTFPDEGACPYINEGKPHVIYRSNVINTRRLVVVEEPDFDRPTTLTCEGEELRSIYTFKVCLEWQDEHKADGLALIRVRPDGSIERTHASKEKPASQDYK